MANPRALVRIWRGRGRPTDPVEQLDELDSINVTGHAVRPTEAGETVSREARRRPGDTYAADIKASGWW